MQVVRLLVNLVSVSLMVMPEMCFSAPRQLDSVMATTPSHVEHVIPAPLKIEHVGNFIGLEGWKRNATGDLVVDKSRMLFTSGDQSASIPLHSILSVKVTHDDVALIKGAMGTMASMAPYGAGQVFSAIRPASDTLTMLYRDRFHGIHASVINLPKGAGDQVENTLLAFKVAVGEMPASTIFGRPESPISNKTVPRNAAGKPSVEVRLLSKAVDGIPFSYAAAGYEDLVVELEASNLFAHVWRQDDVQQRSDDLVLRVQILDLKKGSARMRGIVPFAGATLIKAHASLTTPSGETVLESDVNGAKRSHGENLEAINGLAKKIRKDLQHDPYFKTSK